MYVSGKIVGLFVGSIFFPFPFGALLGLVLGHLYDVGYFSRFIAQAGPRGPQFRSQAGATQAFFDSSFSIMGYIAKADGRVSQKEIQMVEHLMSRLQITGERRVRAIDHFKLGKSPNFDYRGVLADLRRACTFQPGLLKTFLEMQVQVAMADGQLSPPSREALRQVFAGLGIPSAMFDRFERQTRAGYSYQRYQQSRGSYQDPQQCLSDAYAILEVAASASDAEVKKAYRRMMSKHHPDRLMAKGVPPEMIKLANQKTQQIKQAYESIKQARGLN